MSKRSGKSDLSNSPNLSDLSDLSDIGLKELVAIVDPDDAKIKIKPRTNYEKLLKILLMGYIIIIDCDRKKAHYITKALNKKANEKGLNILIEYSKCLYNDKEYYAFYVGVMEI